MLSYIRKENYMKKYYILSIIILSVIVIAGDIVYMLDWKLWQKALTSVAFVLIGAVGFIYALKNKYSNIKYPIFMLIGLTLAMLGDIIINIEFMSGAIIFAVGHVFYFIAYTYLLKFQWKNIIPSIFIFVPSASLIIFAPIFNYGGILMEIVCVIYALIISLMTGKAISLLLSKKSVSNLLTALGSILFCFSDLMLLFDQFSSAGNIVLYLCLCTYYPAQILLSYSIFHNCIEQK